jgi:hypothetical protein
MAELITLTRSTRYRNVEDLRRAGIISAETAQRVRAAGERTKVITHLVCQRLKAGHALQSLVFLYCQKGALKA